MSIVSIKNLAGGLVKDVNTEFLSSDPMIWTDATNIRFYNGSVYNTMGSEIALTTPIQAIYALSVNNDQKTQLIVCGQNQVHVYYSGTWSNITNIIGDYNATNGNWQHCFINNFPILNNGTNLPQTWTSSDQDVKLVDLPGWNLSHTCQVIRSFKAYLIAGSLIEEGKVYNTRIRWSSGALPGSIPQSWDESDLTNDAGYIDLSDTPGDIIDMRVLGDNLIIYKQRAMYLCMYIGGNSIFSFKQIFNNIGAITKNCICDINGQHFVVTTDDVILTDGNSYKSVIDGKIRKYLFNSINQSKYNKMYVVPNYIATEIWVCIPTGTSAEVNKAFIFNYQTGVWSIRSLNQIPYISNMPLDITISATYNSSSTVTYSSANFVYNLSNYAANQQYLMGCDFTNSKLIKFDSLVSTDSGTSLPVTLERLNVTLSDDESIKIVKQLWPKMTKISGTTNSVNFYIGTQMKKNEAITWTAAMPFDISTGDKLDFFATGRFISIRIESTADVLWSLENIDIDVVSGGQW